MIEYLKIIINPDLIKSISGLCVAIAISKLILSLRESIKKKIEQ